MKVAATFDYENTLWKQNKKHIVGIDEVGRGAWAGPLVAGAVVFPKNFQTKERFFDSKLLTEKQRQQTSKIIYSEAVSFGIGQVTVEEITSLGLTSATQLAYQRALNQLNLTPDHYLIDAFYLKHLDKLNQTPIVHGDYLCASIAAASIIAKVYRDQLMIKLSRIYQSYNFQNNKGYGTKFHQNALSQFGLSDLHRRNYNFQVLNG